MLGTIATILGALAGAAVFGTAFYEIEIRGRKGRR